MKRGGLLLALFAAGVALVLLGAAPASQEGGFGRYELFQGEFYHFQYASTLPDAPLSEREKQTGVFMVDTATGKTWIYYQSNQVGMKWLEVEPPAQR